MDAQATDTIGATPAPRAGRDLAGRPSIVWFFAAAVLMGAPMCFMLMTVWAPASSAIYLFAGFIGACGVALAVLLAREFRSVASEYVAAADRRGFLARLDAEARRSKLVLDPPAGSTPTVPAEARIVPTSPAHRGGWWDVRVSFEGDLAALTGPRYLVKDFAKRLR